MECRYCGEWMLDGNSYYTKDDNGKTYLIETDVCPNCGEIREYYTLVDNA